MNCVTYSLKLDQDNSDDYYCAVREVSKKIKDKILFGGNDYLNEFMQFIMNENLEQLRTKEEYGLELLLIGIMFEEYIDNVRHFKVLTRNIFIKLNNLRGKYDNYKVKIDMIRGKLVTNILMKKKYVYKEISIEDFKILLKWMEASGDFKEEVLRLKNWEKFLLYKGMYYSVDMFMFCKMMAVKSYELSKDALGCYTKYVSNYLEGYKKDHNNKEDIVYCGKGEIQYFFNMISAEVINEVYRNDFLNSKEKLAFLPECMRDKSKLCLSTKTQKGYKCNKCCNSCNIGNLTLLGERNGFDVYIIPHECEEFSNENTQSYDRGVIVISCVLNLYSENLKSIRLGYKPQCSILDYCGCAQHWCRKNIMTSINIDELMHIVGIEKSK